MSRIVHIAGKRHALQHQWHALENNKEFTFIEEVLTGDHRSAASRACARGANRDLHHILQGVLTCSSHCSACTEKLCILEIAGD